ncbi:EamA/RhaT family transporter [Paracoccus sp. (in: a-proteobacteria)]|uniref:EamA family transporter n=1 Tax=Paracoccus sp. TaxID=267 RepID=UPI003A857EA9
MIWVLATLIAAAAQTGRNAAQAGLTGRIGTIGATAVRFFFGLPFALLLLIAMSSLVALPMPDARVLGFAIVGGGAQIAATAFMLLTMRGQNFGVATALMKTEPVTIALISMLALSEPLGTGRLTAIAVATLGVVIASGAEWTRASMRPVITGITAGGLFGLSAIGFRGALLALPDGGFFIRALTVLTLSLAMQSLVMLIWLAVADRAALRGIRAEWRVSVGAGALGALASLFWFIGFAVTSAANVRTLALIEVVFAQIVSGKVFREATGRLQLAGMALIVLGVGWLLAITV